MKKKIIGKIGKKIKAPLIFASCLPLPIRRQGSTSERMAGGANAAMFGGGYAYIKKEDNNQPEHSNYVKKSRQKKVS